MSNNRGDGGDRDSDDSDTPLFTQDPRLMKRKFFQAFASNQHGDASGSGNENVTGGFKITATTEASTHHVNQPTTVQSRVEPRDYSLLSVSAPRVVGHGRNRDIGSQVYHHDPNCDEFIRSVFSPGSTGGLTGPVPLIPMPSRFLYQSNDGSSDLHPYNRSSSVTEEPVNSPSINYSFQSRTPGEHLEYSKMPTKSWENFRQPQFSNPVSSSTMLPPVPVVGIPPPADPLLTAPPSTSKEESTSNKKQIAGELTAGFAGEKKNPVLSRVMIGKRRGGGRALPTGVIKKPDVIKPVANKSNAKEQPWSRYMAEVERYKSQTCSEEAPNRSLVK